MTYIANTFNEPPKPRRIFATEWELVLTPEGEALVREFEDVHPGPLQNYLPDPDAGLGAASKMVDVIIDKDMLVVLGDVNIRITLEDVDPAAIAKTIRDAQAALQNGAEL